MRHARIPVLFFLALAACKKEAPAVLASTPSPSIPPLLARPPFAERADVHLHADPDLFEVVLRLGATVGIERFVNLSGGTLPELKENLEAARAFGGRILNCANLDWELMASPDFGEIMARQLEVAATMGAVCLKIPKALGLGIEDEKGRLLSVDDPRLRGVWRVAAEKRMPVFIHVADPKAFWLPLDRNNERYDELIIHPRWSFADKRFPRREVLLLQFEDLLRNNPATTFVGVHFGNDPEDVDATDARLDRYPNLWIDTAARVGEIGRTPPEKLRAFFIKHQDRVLFGTDLGVTGGGLMLGSTDDKEPTWAEARTFFALHWRFFETADRDIPHPTPIQGRWRVNAINLPPEVLRKFYLGNAIRLLRWPVLKPSAIPITPLPESLQ